MLLQCSLLQSQAVHCDVMRVLKYVALFLCRFEVLKMFLVGFCIDLKCCEVCLIGSCNDFNWCEVCLVGVGHDLRCCEVFLVGFCKDLRCFEVFRCVCEVF